MNKKQKLAHLQHVIAPENLGDAPSDAACAKIKLCIRNGVFGRRNKMRAMLKTHGAVNNDIVRLFDRAPQPDKDEEAVYAKLQKYCSANKLHLPQRERVIRELARLRTLDTDNMQTCAEFCVQSAQIAKTRVALLLASGCKHAETQLYEAAQILQEREVAMLSAWRRVHPNQKCPFSLARKMVHQFGPSFKLPVCFEFTHIMNVLSAFGKGKEQLMDLLSELVDSSETARKLRECRTDNVVKLKARSPWHAEMYEDMLVRERAKHSVAFMDRHVRDISSKFAAFVLALDSRVQDLPSFLAQASIADLENALRSVVATHKPNNKAVKTSRNEHHCKNAAAQVLHFVKTHLKHYIGCARELDLLSVKKLLADIPNLRQSAHPLQRRTFTDAEIQLIAEQARDPSESLLITLLQQVALRNSAIGHLQYSTLLDDSHTPRLVCAVKEKGNKWRTFKTSAELQARIKTLSDHLFTLHTVHTDVSHFYLLNLKHPQSPLSCAAILEKLKRMARDANIHGVAVHPHAFRHTLVTKLCDLGNSLETVSKFMGHSNVQTTNYFYWMPSAENLQKNMRNPFDDDYTHPQTVETENEIVLRAANAKVRVCREIIDLFVRLQSVEQVTKAKPDWREVLECVDMPLALPVMQQEHIRAVSQMDEHEDFV
jgi:integrase